MYTFLQRISRQVEQLLSLFFGFSSIGFRGTTKLINGPCSLEIWGLSLIPGLGRDIAVTLGSKRGWWMVKLALIAILAPTSQSEVPAIL